MKPDAFSSSFFQSARSCVWLRCFSFRPSWWRTKTSSSLNEMRRLPSMSMLLKSVKKLRKSGSLPLSASLNFLDSDTTSSSLSSSAKATRAIISRPLSLSYSALASSASNRLRSLCSSILASDAARVNSRFALALSCARRSAAACSLADAAAMILADAVEAAWRWSTSFRFHAGIGGGSTAALVGDFVGAPLGCVCPAPASADLKPIFSSGS